MKYADFQVVTRSRTVSEPFAGPEEVERFAEALLNPLSPVAKGIRLIGVNVSTLKEAAASPVPDRQLSLL
ncbi:DinB/UmuC family translesion DNA polymerase [Bosea sp. NPDC055332]